MARIVVASLPFAGHVGDLLLPAMSGLAGERVLVVCSTGAASDMDIPANARTAPFLPHDLLLPLVDVMVTNGGWNGVLAAVDAGVPLVVAGATLDKPEVARRVAWSGAGLNLRTGKPGPRRIRDAVRRVLAEPRIKQRAGEIGARLAQGGGTAAAVDLIEGLTR
ncbi:glycosyltransferase [Hamadaea tsunoensis]|uniref:glycosyltransferase n=1 Tax=Hamadaea tsunoensis TaxID=53368 RepID=UPI000486D7B6|nr:nucleotide disphospho-sugar-binding domain-containing protein [Hamadaea tsunoensis]